MASSVSESTQRLQQLLNGRSLVVVTNREPFHISRKDDAIKLEKTTGGLVSALDPVLQTSNGLWICWDISTEPESDFEDLCHLAELNHVKIPYRIKTVKLSEDDVERYYYGFANRQLWPLFHYFPSRYAFDERDWERYVSVNEKFARAVIENADANDLVWVQDYQLMMVPHFIRQLRPAANVGFFCHIPFPHYEVFRMLPTRREILEGMLGSDLIGFHTPLYATYFMESAARLLSDQVHILDDHRLRYRDRIIHVGAFPISIDFNVIDTLARKPETDDAVKQLRGLFPGIEYMGLGVDRLDYTKGILERLEGVGLFFERYPQYKRRMVFIQIAVPSRTKVLEYQQMKQEIDEAVGRINGRHSEEGWSPIHYLYRSFPLEDLVAHYKAADFALINPLRDGMNLVAKEYCAAQTENTGALVLSEMTGAAYQMSESFLVNPYDHPAVVEALYSALNTPPELKRDSMKQLRDGIRENDINAWLSAFLEQFQVALDHRQNATP